MSADVVVVGGGPAGAAAAIGCARAGLETVLVEAEPDPRPRPFESLQPDVEGLLLDLGVGGFGEWARYGAIETDGERIAFAQGEGAHVDRAAFDASLRARAAELGVRQIHERVNGIVRTADRVTGVTFPSERIDATWVVDASGHRGLLARRLRLGERRLSKPLIAWRGEVARTSPSEPRFESLADGWQWSAGVAPGRTVWTALRVEGRRGLPPHLADAPQTLPPKGRDVTWRLARPMAGAGYLLVGEAAAVFDPACGQGVHFALTSGLAAADAIVGVARARAREPLFLARFDDAMVRRAEFICANLSTLYRRRNIAEFAS